MEKWINTRTGEEYTVTAKPAGLSWYDDGDGLWHTGCGGEVVSTEDGLACVKCGAPSGEA